VLTLVLALSLAAAPVGAVPAPVHVILVRHGQAYSNLKHGSSVPYVQLDRLTPLGHDQARRAGRAVAPMHVVAVVASPAQRTRETAQDIEAAVGALPVQLDDGIEPLKEGRRADGRRLTWDERRESWKAHQDPSPPGGESLQQLGDRALTSMRAIAAQHPGGTVLLVTHAEVISALLAEADHQRPVDRYQTKVPNGSITLVDVDTDGTLRVRQRCKVPRS
jgi:broad specificity phosphatase PhoE